VRLAHEAPRAIVDTGFKSFGCPPDIQRVHWSEAGGASVRKSSDAPVFDFYSIWACLMYRALLGG
jgi:hypothetical protein